MTYYNYEIEYQKPDGEYDYINVVFETTILRQNSGIGSYEYWGSKGYDAGQDYYECDGIDWDRKSHDEETNQRIEDYLEKNYDRIEELIIESMNDY